MKELNCPICNEVVYSGIGYGCKMCGMLLEENQTNFCCKTCIKKYKTINKKLKLLIK